jgi:hypothetical protein
MGVEVTLDRLPKVITSMGPLAREAIIDAALETAEYGVNAIKFTISRTTPQPIATKEYKDSWRVKRTRAGAKIENTSKQAYYVEHGRKPGPAPIDPFMEWARAKIGAGRTGLSVKQLAFLARRKVERFGYKGRHVVKRTVPRIQAFLRKALKRKLAEVGIKAAKMSGRASARVR